MRASAPHTYRQKAKAREHASTQDGSHYRCDARATFAWEHASKPTARQCYEASTRTLRTLVINPATKSYTRSNAGTDRNTAISGLHRNLIPGTSSATADSGFASKQCSPSTSPWPCDSPIPKYATGQPPRPNSTFVTLTQHVILEYKSISKHNTTNIRPSFLAETAISHSDG